jgi:hypothetical protein
MLLFVERLPKVGPLQLADRGRCVCYDMLTVGLFAPFVFGSFLHSSVCLFAPFVFGFFLHSSVCLFAPYVFGFFLHSSVCLFAPYVLVSFCIPQCVCLHPMFLVSFCIRIREVFDFRHIRCNIDFFTQRRRRQFCLSSVTI